MKANTENPDFADELVGAAAHIDLTLDGNVSALLDKVEGLNMLVMPEVNGLPNPRRQQGLRRFAGYCTA